VSDLRKQIAEGAASAVTHLRERPGTLLDYSEGSLAVVEEVLAEIASFGPLGPKEMDALVSLVGAYILETAVRAHGGVFYWHDQRDQPVLVVGEPDHHIGLLAFDKVRGRLSGDEADNIPFFYEGFAARVRSATPGLHVLYV
jgi:hypothetical protein